MIAATPFSFPFSCLLDSGGSANVADGLHMIESEIKANADVASDGDCAWTSASVQKDFVDWRKGRQHYAVWAIDLGLHRLRVACSRMRQRCKEYLLPDYGRQPHVTLRICGFPGPDRWADDDYTRADFEAQVRTLQAARIQPFSISVGALETFTTAPYFSVFDIEGGIARARQALVMPGGDGPGEKGLPYVPHVTFGLYGGRFPMSEVTRRLQSSPEEMANVQLTVRQLALMTYEASVVASPLTSVCAFDLEYQTVRAVDPAAMEALFP